MNPNPASQPASGNVTRDAAVPGALGTKPTPNTVASRTQPTAGLSENRSGLLATADKVPVIFDQVVYTRVDGHNRHGEKQEGNTPVGVFHVILHRTQGPLGH